jgi:hypothetical protein
MECSPFKVPWGGGAWVVGVISWYSHVRGSLEIHGDTFFLLLWTLPVKSYSQLTTKNGDMSSAARYQYHQRRQRHLGVKTTVTLLDFRIRVWWSGGKPFTFKAITECVFDARICFANS